MCRENHWAEISPLGYETYCIWTLHKSSVSLGSLIAIMINLQPSILKDCSAAAFAQSSQRQPWVSGNKSRLCDFAQPSAHNYNQDGWETLLWFFFFFPTGGSLWRPHMHHCNYIIAGQQQDRKLWLMNDSRLPPVNAVLLKKGCRTMCRIVWKIFSRRFYFHRNLPFSPLFPHIPDKIYATNVYTSLYLTLAQNTMTVKGGWYQAYHNNAFRLHCLYIETAATEMIAVP